MNSKRKFLVVGFENGVKIEKEYSLSQLFDKSDDTELTYSLSEITDTILDLKVDETLFIKVNRDIENSKGVIVRVL